MKKNNRLSGRPRIITSTDKTGFMFVLPFVLGFIFLFARPMAESLRWCFHNVKGGSEGLEITYVGWENFKLMWDDRAFKENFLSALTTLLYKVPITMFLSMFLAIVLNNEFSGRLFFRMVLFLPVIFASDQIMGAINDDLFKGSVDVGNTDSAFAEASTEASGLVNSIISSFGALTPYIQKFTKYANSLYSLLWNCGIQIILFVIGLKAIPPYLYEVADMEGATAWETFWKITFPLLTPSMLLCLIYTLVSTFNSKQNYFIRLVAQSLDNRIGLGVAMSWFYALVELGIVLIIYVVLSRKTVKLD